MTADLRTLAEAATPGPWFWYGNSDYHSIALCGRQPGLGVAEVISTVRVERSKTSHEAEMRRSELADLGYEDEQIDNLIDEWANDDYGPMYDDRLSITDENYIMRPVNELAVYEVARAQGLPDDTPRDHPKVYRANVCDLRAANARYLAAANPAAVLDLLDRLDRAEKIAEAAMAYVAAVDAEQGSPEWPHAFRLHREMCAAVRASEWIEGDES